MHKFHSVSWVVGLSLVALGCMTNPAQADRSYSDITGTNIWNNTAPIFDTDGMLDPALIERVQQFNQESEQAFQACNAAIAQAENAVPTTRRFARQPGAETVAVPTACQRLDELRTEAESLKVTLDEAARSRANPALQTW